MPSIAELRNARLAAVAARTTTTPAPAPAPATPTSAADLAAALAHVDALIAASNAPAKSVAKAIETAHGPATDDQLRAQFNADPELIVKFGGKANAFIGMVRHQQSGAFCAERAMATRSAPKGGKEAPRVSADAQRAITGLSGEALWKAQYAASVELREEFYSEGAYIGFKANEAKITGQRA